MRVWVLVIYTALSLSAATAAVLKPSPAFGATEQRTKQPEPKAEPAAKKEPSRTTPQDQEAVSAEDTKASEAREDVSLPPGIASGPEDKDTKDRKRVEPTAVRLQRPSDIDDRQKFVRENRPAWDNVPAYIRSARPERAETLPNVRAERPSIYGNPPFAEPYTPPVTELSPETEPSAPAKPGKIKRPQRPRKTTAAKSTPATSGAQKKARQRPETEETGIQQASPRERLGSKERKKAMSTETTPGEVGKPSKPEPAKPNKETETVEPAPAVPGKVPHKASKTPHTSPGERAGPEGNQEAEPGMTSDSGIRT